MLLTDSSQKKTVEKDFLIGEVFFLYRLRVTWGDHACMGRFTFRFSRCEGHGPEEDMHVFIHIFGWKIPGYGLFISLGVVLANLIALHILKKNGEDTNDFFILEGCGFLGGIVGSKALYLITAWDTIDWSRLTDPDYFNGLMTGGFVFYGGIIFAFLFILLAGKLFHLPAVHYLREVIFLIPFAHGFGRIGCFMAGCCYGIPYTGPFAVTFPEGSWGLAGVSLFPVQLAESMCLFAISLLIYLLQTRAGWQYTIETYLVLYAIVRFVLENLRYDSIRGIYGGLSTSQWISIGMLAAGFLIGFIHRHQASGRHGSV